MKRPWDRQPYESPEYYRAFQIYLHSNPRKKGAVSPLMGRSTGWIYRIAKDFHWDERADEYDAWQQSIEDQVAEDEITRATREHLGVIHLARELGLKTLEKHLEGIDTSDPLAVGSVWPMIRDSINLERTILGEPTERSEVKWDLSELTAEEIRALRELKRKAGVPES